MKSCVECELRTLCKAKAKADELLNIYEILLPSSDDYEAPVVSTRSKFKQLFTKNLFELLAKDCQAKIGR